LTKFEKNLSMNIMKRLLLISLIVGFLFSCNDEVVPLHLGDVITRDNNSSWTLSSYNINGVNFIDSLDECIVNAEVNFNINNRFIMTSDDITCELGEEMSEGFWDVDINSQFFSWFDVTNNQVTEFIIDDVQINNFTISTSDELGQVSQLIYSLK